MNDRLWIWEERDGDRWHPVASPVRPEFVQGPSGPRRIKRMVGIGAVARPEAPVEVDAADIDLPLDTLVARYLRTPATT